MMSQDASGSSETNLVRYPYRRGAKLVGADGQMVGTLEQLVVDRDSGVLRSLIVRSADGAREFELPEEHVSQNEGDTVRLSVGADELAANPELARPYNPREFQPVPPGEPAGHNRASRVALQTGQPVVASVGDNAADVVAPESLYAPPLGNGSAAAHEAGPQPPRRDDSTAQRIAGGAPDVTAGGPALSDAQEAAPAHEGTPPPQTPSATESTSGELIGGKPSTGDMGSASVAPVQSYPQDAAPTATDSPDEADRTADRGAVEPLPARGDRLEFSSPAAPSAHMPADEGLRSNQGASSASQATCTDAGSQLGYVGRARDEQQHRHGRSRRHHDAAQAAARRAGREKRAAHADGEFASGGRAGARHGGASRHSCRACAATGGARRETRRRQERSMVPARSAPWRGARHPLRAAAGCAAARAAKRKR